MDKDFMQEVGFFFLSALIIVSLSYFVSGVNEYIKGERAIATIGQAGFSSTSNTGPEPLVLLFVSPGIGDGSDVNVRWELSENAQSCIAEASPEVSLWSGAKVSTEGVHTETIGSIEDDTKFSIECVGENGRRSISSMTAVVE